MHHNKDGEFSNIDWQKVSRADFQQVKDIFDDLKGDITKMAAKVHAAEDLALKMAGMKVED